MITEQDLQEAIAECQGQRNPNANTCIKLAAFYTIKEHLYPEKTQLPEEISIPQLSYSRAAPPEPTETTIEYTSGSDFGKAVRGRTAAEVWPLIDELVTTIQALHPRLYAGFMRQFE